MSNPFDELAKLAQRKPVYFAGKTLYVRVFSALDRDDYFAWLATQHEAKELRGVSTWLVLNGIETEAGERPTREQVEAMPGHVVELLARRVSDHNMLAPSAMDEAEKNLTAAPACGV